MGTLKLNLFFPMLLTALVAFLAWSAPTSADSEYEVYLPVMTDDLPDPLSAYILPNHTAFEDSLGDLNIVGEVENDGTAPIRAFQVTVNLYDRTGRIVATESAYTRLSNLPPKDRTCFRIPFTDPDNWSYYRVKTPLDLSEGDPPPDLRVESQTDTYMSNSGWYRILGEVKNYDDRSVRSVKMIGTLYDEQERVVGCGFAYVEDYPLSPDERSDFKLLFTGRDYEDVARQRLQPEGRSR